MADDAAGFLSGDEQVLIVGVLAVGVVRALVSDEDHFIVLIFDRLIVEVFVVVKAVCRKTVCRKTGEFVRRLACGSAGFDWFAKLVRLAFGGILAGRFGGLCGCGKFLARLARGFPLASDILDGLVESLNLVVGQRPISTFGQIGQFQRADGDAFE